MSQTSKHLVMRQQYQVLHYHNNAWSGKPPPKPLASWKRLPTLAKKNCWSLRAAAAERQRKLAVHFHKSSLPLFWSTGLISQMSLNGKPSGTRCNWKIQHVRPPESLWIIMNICYRLWIFVPFLIVSLFSFPTNPSPFGSAGGCAYESIWA